MIVWNGPECRPPTGCDDSTDRTAGAAGDHHDNPLSHDHGVLPWLMLLLVAGVVPLSWAKAILPSWDTAKISGRTPMRRNWDYLRILGGKQRSRQRS